MSGVTVASLDKALKEFYEPRLHNQLTVNSYIAKRIEASDKFEQRGRRAVVALQTAWGGNTGMAGENEDLPEAGSEEFENAYFTLSYHFGSIEISGQAIEASATDKAAFIRGLTAQIKSTQDELLNDEVRQLYGDGEAKLGEVASVSTVGGVSVVVLTSAENILRNHLYKNRRLTIGSLAAPTVGSADSRITARNAATPSITLSVNDTATIAAGQFVFPHGSRAAGSVSKEMAGLLRLVDDTLSVGGIDPTVAGNDYWASSVDSAGGTPTLARIKTQLNWVLRNQGNVSLMLSTPGVENEVYEELADTVRQPQRDTIEGGFTKIVVHGKDLVADPAAPFGTLLGVDERDYKVYSNSPWHFLEGYASGGAGEGSVLRMKSNKYAYEGKLYRPMTLGATMRKRSFKMEGLTDPDGI